MPYDAQVKRVCTRLILVVKSSRMSTKVAWRNPEYHQPSNLPKLQAFAASPKSANVSHTKPRKLPPEAISVKILLSFFNSI